MNYWINHKGVQSGPVDLDGMKQMGLTDEAYVWREGLTDWVKITQLPELQGVYGMAGAPTTQQPASQPEVPRQSETVTGQPYQQPAQPYQQPQYAGTQPAASEPCPPTNLVWAIITTVLCCIPTGIVAIVYALKVSRKYNEGDIEGAKRASETGAWWCIITIILGLLYVPLALMIKSFSMGMSM